jgi:RNA polymerase sigma factor (TIGR02999 family)
MAHVPDLGKECRRRVTWTSELRHGNGQMYVRSWWQVIDPQSSVRTGAVDWQDRAHFLGIAARLMRRVLVARPRAGGAETRRRRDQGSVRRRHGRHRTAGLDLLALDRAVEALAPIDERKCRVVDMRFFAGMTVEERAEALHVSIDTVKRDWRIAKLWLLREMTEPTP